MSADRTSDASPGLAHVHESLKSLVSGPKLKDALAFATRLFEHLPEDEFGGRAAAVWATSAGVMGKDPFSRLIRHRGRANAPA